MSNSNSSFKTLLLDYLIHDKTEMLECLQKIVANNNDLYERWHGLNGKWPIDATGDRCPRVTASKKNKESYKKRNITPLSDNDYYINTDSDNNSIEFSQKNFTPNITFNSSQMDGSLGSTSTELGQNNLFILQKSKVNLWKSLNHFRKMCIFKIL